MCDRPGRTNEVQTCCPLCSGNLCIIHAGSLQNYSLRELDELVVVLPGFAPSLCHQHGGYRGCRCPSCRAENHEGGVVVVVDAD